MAAAQRYLDLASQYAKRDMQMQVTWTDNMEGFEGGEVHHNDNLKFNDPLHDMVILAITTMRHPESWRQVTVVGWRCGQRASAAGGVCVVRPSMAKR